MMSPWRLLAHTDNFIQQINPNKPILTKAPLSAVATMHPGPPPVQRSAFMTLVAAATKAARAQADLLASSDLTPTLDPDDDPNHPQKSSVSGLPGTDLALISSSMYDPSIDAARPASGVDTLGIQRYRTGGRSWREPERGAQSTISIAQVFQVCHLPVDPGQAK